MILNLSPAKQYLSWTDHPTANTWTNVFDGMKESVDENLTLKPWDFAVFEIKR